MLSISPKNSVSTSQRASFVVSYSLRHWKSSSTGRAEGVCGRFQFKRKLKQVEIGSFKNMSLYTKAKSLKVSSLGNALKERPSPLVLRSKGINFML